MGHWSAKSEPIPLHVVEGGREPAAAEGPSHAVEDAIWVTLAIGHDRQAQEVLFRRHLARTRQRVCRLLGPDAEVDDVVQETFLEAFENLRTLKDPKTFGGWVLTIAVHRVSRRLRRRRMLRRLGFLPAGDRRAAAEDVASPAPSPALAAEARAVYVRLNALPSEARVAFLLRHLEDLTIPEIASQMGLSERTVKRRIAAVAAGMSAVLVLHRREGQS